MHLVVTVSDTSRLSMARPIHGSNARTCRQACTLWERPTPRWYLDDSGAGTRCGPRLLQNDKAPQALSNVSYLDSSYAIASFQCYHSSC